MLMLGNCFPKLNYFRRLIEESLSSQSINKFVIRLPRLIKEKWLNVKVTTLIRKILFY